MCSDSFPVLPVQGQRLQNSSGFWNNPRVLWCHLRAPGSEHRQKPSQPRCSPAFWPSKTHTPEGVNAKARIPEGVNPKAQTLNPQEPALLRALPVHPCAAPRSGAAAHGRTRLNPGAGLGLFGFGAGFGLFGFGLDEIPSPAACMRLLSEQRRLGVGASLPFIRG